MSIITDCLEHWDHIRQAYTAVRAHDLHCDNDTTALFNQCEQQIQSFAKLARRVFDELVPKEQQGSPHATKLREAIELAEFMGKPQDAGFSDLTGR